MDIAALNVRVAFQKNTACVDKYQNHTNQWKDYFSCWATASMTGGGEVDASATTDETETTDFTCRYCSELSEVSPTGYRIVARGVIYNILSVNPMGFNNNSLKFHCEKERGSVREKQKSEH